VARCRPSGREIPHRRPANYVPNAGFDLTMGLVLSAPNPTAAIRPGAGAALAVAQTGESMEKLRPDVTGVRSAVAGFPRLTSVAR